MKKYFFPILAFLAILLWGLTSRPPAVADNSAGLDRPKFLASAGGASAGYLENVLLEKLPGRERIALLVSLQPQVSVGTQSDGSLIIRMENMFLPENMRRVFDGNVLDNIFSVTPVQQSQEGRLSIHLNIKMKQPAPYAVTQQGNRVLIDFNVSGLSERKTVSPKRRASAETVRTEPASAQREVASIRETPKRQTDRLMSLDFQDADIKSVLRLMAEYGNISIVSGEDVKGNVTLTMKNVPWEQALDTILEVNGFAKRQTGDVIRVVTLEKKKKEEADKLKAEEELRKAEDLRKERELKILAEKGQLRQILIEAKIVETTESFLRELGVQWGFGNRQSISGTYGLGVAGGTSTSTKNPFGMRYPPEIGATDSVGKSLTMAAVNFPVTLSAPAIGLVFGGATGFLEAQLSALETNSTGRVISSPKVVTMDNVKATIKQGDEVPYVTPASGTSPASITFKEAVLKLEVKPKITDEGKVSMQIRATNDTPDYARGQTLQGNPPIRKNEVESTVVIPNGNTVVIGGIVKSSDDTSVSGVPWLHKIPVLGWLFKSDSIQREKRQLFIFVTPKIIAGDLPAEEALPKPITDRQKS